MDPQTYYGLKSSLIYYINFNISLLFLWSFSKYQGRENSPKNINIYTIDIRSSLLVVAKLLRLKLKLRENYYAYLLPKTMLPSKVEVEVYSIWKPSLVINDLLNPKSIK